MRVFAVTIQSIYGFFLYDLKNYDCRLRMDELSVKCRLYADDQISLMLSMCGLQEMVTKINNSVEKRGMKVEANAPTECHIYIVVVDLRAGGMSGIRPSCLVSQMRVRV
ncbi:hypothetical protein EVAR_102646_1 [Eumeta japonica]|uniref:Reverse transcriptase domain-containing protein n=1 Tax=Eumeta variegata TaxID=151549 RepID=A0A4C1TUV6_EUMVA|nr:hypothetical protein EVAR_102646_1 [Eumeta japonica]